jgi:hypothetical protein
VASYYIRNGNEIIFKRQGHTSVREISAFLTGASFGALLHQRQLLPLHACTVIFNNKCFVFAGISGAGKSTLAMAFVKAGGILVADDISVINISGEKTVVCPSFPSVKIWEDSLKHLGISSEELDPVRGELKKFYLPVIRFHNKSSVISHLYILNTHNRPQIEFKPLHGVNKFRILIKHTYLFRGIPKTRLAQNHFLLVNQLIAQVPITLIFRPSGEFNTGKLLQAILERP